MRISWNWLSEWVDLKDVGTPRRLAELMTLRGLEAEEVHVLSEGMEKVVTARLLERQSHPQADRLSLCKVSTGQGEPLEIVCGAQNMKAGDVVALAQVGAVLPNGLAISQSKIRGVVSNGMLCSEEELKLKEHSEGILILPPDTPIGKPLAEVLGLNDAILTFKLTANRGDCLSHRGMAREVAAAQGQRLKRPEIPLVSFENSPISIRLEAGESAPQFLGCMIEGVKVGPSPDWVVRRLESLGSRSINNVVDATNWVMLEMGHPVHAYDADLIEGGQIGVRMARKGEKLPLLDGQEVELAGSELVIFDGKRAVGLAGVMGGGNSEVRDSTTRVFLECAEFSPSLVRRAAARHQKRTEAAHRFERGVDPEALPQVISRLAQLITQWAGGKVTGGAEARHESRKSGAVSRRPAIGVKPGYFNEFLGTHLQTGRIREVLEAHECQVIEEVTSAGEAVWRVEPPSYRLDLSIAEDLAEEVARSVGYDQIGSTIPSLTSKPASGAAAGLDMALIDRAKDSLVRLGYLETLNYGFTSAAWLSELGMASTARLLNPLSEEYEVLVPSLIPGLIKNALHNWRHHFGAESLAIRLFELRPTFHASGDAGGAISARGQMETNLSERWKLSLVLSGPRFAEGLRQERGEVDFYDLKAAVEGVLRDLGARGVRFQPLGAGSDLLHPGQSVEILAGNQQAGFMGLLHPKKALELKTRAPLWIAELDWEKISKLSRPATESPAYKPLPEFPSMERDFALVVNSDIPAEKITQLALKAGKPLAKVAKVFDIYRGSQVAEGMTSVAVRVIFYDEKRVLQESETEEASARILEAWKKELRAELRG